MKIPTHITDLSRGDFEEIARIVNLQVGNGLVLDPRGGGYFLRIDENWLRNFVANIAFNLSEEPQS